MSRRREKLGERLGCTKTQ